MKLYSIGDTAKIMGVSVQALRYYDKIKLLEPKYISPSTGYRYYTYDQFHYIDRIKYLQNFGFTLDEIRSIILTNNINKLVSMLDDKKQALNEEIKKIQQNIDLMTWYHNYFIKAQHLNKSHVSHFDTRYMVCTKIKNDESRENYHIRLHKIRHSSKLKDLEYMRQFSLILDYNDFMNAAYHPTYIGMFLRESQEINSPYVMKIPAGNYYCMPAQVLCQEWSPYEATVYFSQFNEKPRLVLANEFEDNLQEYNNCLYEIQILIPERY